MSHDAAFQRAPVAVTEGLAPGVVARLTFKATFRWVRRAIHEAMEALERHDLPAEDMGTIEIVLAEALNNVVEHAYDENDPGDVVLILRLRGAGLMVEIRDSGRPMPNGRAPIGNHPVVEFSNDPMPEGGYGWYLIRELVRDLIYDRRDDENILIFRLALGNRLSAT